MAHGHTNRPNRLLNDDQVRAIRRTFDQHEMYKQMAEMTSRKKLAEKYGVSINTINDIIYQISYQDVK
jgi:hypothetical protein